MQILSIAGCTFSTKWSSKLKGAYAKENDPFDSGRGAIIRAIIRTIIRAIIRAITRVIIRAI